MPKPTRMANTVPRASWQLRVLALEAAISYPYQEKMSSSEDPRLGRHAESAARSQVAANEGGALPESRVSRLSPTGAPISDVCISTNASVMPRKNEAGAKPRPGHL